MGVRRRVGVIAAASVGVVVGSYLLVGCLASSNAWMREVPTDVPAAPVVPSISCGPLDASGHREPAHVEGSMPDGFTPARVVWCRADGWGRTGSQGSLVQTTPWTPEWGTRLRAPDRVWFFAPLAEGPCTLVGYEPLHLLVVDGAGDGYRPRIPVDACGESPELRAHVGSVPWEDA